MSRDVRKATPGRPLAMSRDIAKGVGDVARAPGHVAGDVARRAKGPGAMSPRPPKACRWRCRATWKWPHGDVARPSARGDVARALSHMSLAMSRDMGRTAWRCRWALSLSQAMSRDVARRGYGPLATSRDVARRGNGPLAMSPRHGYGPLATSGQPQPPPGAGAGAGAGAGDL